MKENYPLTTFCSVDEFCCAVVNYNLVPILSNRFGLDKHLTYRVSGLWYHKTLRTLYIRMFVHKFMYYE